jgi:NMD protein affecting ribosome stability and mRNA decay
MEKANVINITDKPCSKCGQTGAFDNGLCMTCAFERFHKIGSKTIEAIRDQVEQMLRTYTLNLNDAYHKMEELKISFAVEIGPGTGGDLVVTTKMNFVESRVKDELEITVNEAQEKLFK